MELTLETRNITKRFGSVVANDKISFSFLAGNIYALLGENGAGKTTYLSTIFGLYEPDEGEIILNGGELHFRSPKEAIERGIYLVQQNFSLIESFTVAENLALLEKASLSSLDLKEVAEKAHLISQKNGLEVDPWSVVGKMPMSFRQRAEILKGLFCDSRILLLDEPTSVLGPREVEELGRAMRTLASDGRIVIFTTHKLEQVLNFSDYISVLRGGRPVISKKTQEVTNTWELANYMVGEDFVPRLPERLEMAKSLIVQAEGIVVRDDKGRVLVDNVSLTTNGREILGIAGVAGNGQKQLAEALVGLTKVHSGTIKFNESVVTNSPHGHLRRLGVGYVPEEGSLIGVVLDFTVAENLSLTTYDTDTSSALLNTRQMKDRAKKLISEFGINPPSEDRLTRHLSGGNMYKVIVARELSRPLKFLVVYNPTKGLDIRTTTLVRRKLLEKRNSGTAIVLISEDLEEILEVSDRVAVMYEGRVSGMKETHQTNIQEVGRMMSGPNSAGVGS